MKKKNMKLVFLFTGLGILVIAFIIVSFLLNIYNDEPEYQYINDEYTSGCSLIIEDIAYIEIGEYDYNEIKEKLMNNGIEQFVDKLIVKIEYPYADEIWKYKIYGSEDIEKRILLKGEEAYVINDANYPEIFFCRIDVLYSYLELTEYRYVSDEHIIEGDAIVYKEIDESTFEMIIDEFNKQNIDWFIFRIVGKISDNDEDEWNLILHGNLKQEERILLRGKERYAFYDENYPEVYYCREDIFSLFEEKDGSFANVDLYEYINQSN